MSTSGVALPERLLTTEEVAELFRIRPLTVGHWVKAGRLPRPVKRGQRTLWKPQDIAALLDGPEAGSGG